MVPGNSKLFIAFIEYSYFDTPSKAFPIKILMPILPGNLTNQYKKNLSFFQTKSDNSTGLSDVFVKQSVKFCKLFVGEIKSRNHLIRNKACFFP